MPASLPFARNILALIGPRFGPLRQRRKRRIRYLGLRALLEDRAWLAWIRIEAESEELRRQSAEVDFSVDDRIGLVFVGERKRLRFLCRQGLRIGRRLRREPHVHILVDSRRKRLERNDTDLSKFAVDSPGDARPAAAPRLEAQCRRQGGDGRKLIE